MAEGLPRRPRQGTKDKWLWNIWNSKKLESEYGNCPGCGRENIEFSVYQLGDGAIRKYKNCPVCTAKLEAAREAEEAALRLIDINNDRLTAIKSSGIPPKFLSQNFETFKKGWQDKALSFCKNYADEFPIGKRPIEYASLYIWSEKSWGVGKTHLSCAIALRIFERWDGKDQKSCPRIYFVSEPNLFRQIQATYSYDREEGRVRESEDDIIKRLTHCDLLILDDIGKEHRADPRFLQRTLFGLIDGRYNLQLPIILTANVDPDGLKRYLDKPPTEASFNRIFEMIQGKSVCMDGQSYRRKGFAEDYRPNKGKK